MADISFLDDVFLESMRLKDHNLFRTDYPEKIVTEKINEILACKFDVFHQVKGTHPSSKVKKRIDMVIVPKFDWDGKNVAFGVELKKDSFLDKNTKDYCRHFSQSVDYANTDWDGFGFLFVLTYPSFIPKWAKDQSLLQRIGGRLGVGELKVFKNNDFSIMINGHHVYCSDRGVIEKQWNFKRKFGSR